MSRRPGAVACALIGTGLLVAPSGCGTPNDVASLRNKTSATTGGAPAATSVPTGASVQKHYQEALKFSECIRSHGITNFPDPSSSGGIDLNSSSGIDPQSAQFQTAQNACRKYFPVPNFSKVQIAQHEAQALEFAKCMRANGVPNFPDPKPISNGPEKFGPIPGVDPNSPTYQAGAKKCSR
ncbi:MAG: hypothetical protein ACRDZX_06255 [Acidimicrobiales bacterium]